MTEIEKYDACEDAIYPDEGGQLHNTYGMGLLDGATDQDKIATNRTVEAAMMIVKEYATIYDEAIILKELEKLRRV